MIHIRNILLTFILVLQQTISIATNEQPNIQNTLNYINQLEHRIDSNIEVLNSRIPQLTSNLYYNIQEIASRSSIPNIISSLQNQILDASDCALNANSQITTLMDSSKADMSQCVDDAISKTGNLAVQTGILLHRANGVKNEVVGRVERCVKNNVANEVTLALCLVAQVFPIQESLGGLEQEIEVTLGVGEETAQNILGGLGDCLLNKESITKEKSSNIFRNYEDCIYFNNLNGK